MARNEFDPKSFTSIPSWLKEQKRIEKEMNIGMKSGVPYQGKKPKDDFEFTEYDELYKRSQNGDNKADIELTLRGKLTDEFMEKDKRFDIKKRTKSVEDLSKSGDKITRAEKAECKRRVTHSVREATIKASLESFNKFSKKDPKGAYMSRFKSADDIVKDFLTVPKDIKLGK